MIGRRIRGGATVTVVSLVTGLAVLGGYPPVVDADSPVASDAGLGIVPPVELGSGVAASADRYLVRFTSETSMERGRAELHGRGLTPGTLADQSVFVLAVEADANQLVGLASRPDVLSVEPEQRFELSTDQSSPPWGLDRIDQPNLPLNSNYSYGATGEGVVIYTIDSGIWYSHSEFTDRIPRSAYWQFDDGFDGWDCNGHGTHVAGTAAGTTYGVAKDASIVPVKAFSCSGTTTTGIIVSAIDWIVDDHVAGTPAVVNMSLSGPASPAVDSAVQSMIDDGITVVAAAGNDAADSCGYSPSRLLSAITVAASASDDAAATFSNHGTCNDLFAPGSDILSAWVGSDVATNTISGTSMAAPHVAGAAAIVLEGNPSYAPSQVWSSIDGNATVGVITECCDDPDKLLYIPPPPDELLSVSTAGDGGGTVTSSPSGIVCGVSCSASFGFGSSVVLVAEAAVGSVFSGWSGGCGGVGVCEVSMTASRSVTATFVSRDELLSVSTAGDGGGTVTSSPSGIVCGVSCSASFGFGSSVVLVAEAAVGSVFSGWSGGCGGVGVCEVSMTASRSVTATFVSRDELLSVSTAGDGGGTVTSSPSGIVCGVSCSASFGFGSSVVLVAEAAVGSVFSGWSGGCGGVGVCEVSMTASRSVTATFANSVPPVPVGGGVGAVVPARLLETRSGPGHVTIDGLFEGVGRRGGGGTLALQVTGRGGVPVDAVAVMLNVTAVLPGAAGFLTVFPCGSALPVASNVNYVAGDVVANAVFVEVGTGGRVCIHTKAAVDIVVDVDGYVPVGGGVGAVVPARLLETRSGPGHVTIDGLFEGVGRRGGGGTLALQVTGRGGVPVDAVAVMLNVTAVLPGAAGFLTVFPCGSALPVASNVNYVAGDVVANAVFVEVGTGGRVCIHTKAAVDIVVDVDGYVPVVGGVGAVVPARLLETRSGPGHVTIDGLFEGVGRRGGGGTLALQVTGRGGVPVDAVAVMLNVTAVLPGAAGFLTVFPCGSALPVASNVNYVAGDVVANAVFVEVGTGGRVCIHTKAAVDIVVDVDGYVP